MKYFWGRVYHLWQRVIRESKSFPTRLKTFGFKVAYESFRDGVIPPGKSERYIRTIEQYVDDYLEELVKEYQEREYVKNVSEEKSPNKTPVWCCWWQGEEKMPEIVKLCNKRLKQVLPSDKAELHLITLKNYLNYVDLPQNIVDKFEAGIITMTTMSDVLRFYLLEKYGGYWLDATVFFSGDIPKEYFMENFFCQRMKDDPIKVQREACKGNWCGFSMSGNKGNIVFKYMKEAFSRWWESYDIIIDYVLIDYLLWTAYRKIPVIKETIDRVPDNNEDIFEMYQMLNLPYSKELYQRVTQRNVMHKLTYKMDLYKETSDGQMTLYGYLIKKVYDENGRFLS